MFSHQLSTLSNRLTIPGVISLHDGANVNVLRGGVSLDVDEGIRGVRHFVPIVFRQYILIRLIVSLFKK